MVVINITHLGLSLNLITNGNYLLTDPEHDFSFQLSSWKPDSVPYMNTFPKIRWFL